MEPGVGGGSLICDFCFLKNLLSNPEVEGEKGVWVVGCVTNFVTPEMVVVGGMHDDGKQYLGGNLIKTPLKGL